MFTRSAVIGLLVCGFTVSAQAADKRQQYRYLVCPPHLDYCYWEYKPIEPKMRDQDAYSEAERRVRALQAESDYKENCIMFKRC